MKVRSVLKAAVAAWLAVQISGCRHAAQREGADIDAIRERIEGIYSLAEWHTASGVFHPPAVDGRATLKNGTIIFVIHDRRQPSAPSTIATYGEYRLSADEFSYRYVSPSTFTEKDGAITVAHVFPWEGMRAFQVIREGSNVRLRAKAGPQEFLFTPDEHIYADGGLDNASVGKRVWRRIQPR